MQFHLKHTHLPTRPPIMISSIRFHRHFLLVTILVTLVVYSFLLSNLHMPRWGSIVTLSWLKASGREDLEVERLLYRELESMGNIPLTNFELQEDPTLHELNLRAHAVAGVGKGNNVRRPKPFEILYSNTYWQVLKTNRTTMYIYNAYLDIRTKSPFVRVLIVSEEPFKGDKTMFPKFCHVWTTKGNETTGGVVTVKYVDKIRRYGGKTGLYHPYLISCPIAEDADVTLPLSVSLTMAESNVVPTNNVKVEFDYLPPLDRKRVGICFKTLEFPGLELSRRFIEMIELTKILGVGGIHFSNMAVHGSVEKVLEYYKNLGYITLKNFTLLGNQPNSPELRHAYLRHSSVKFDNVKTRQEIVPYMDCYYSNMYKYDYLAVLDIDEVVLPMEESVQGYSQLLDFLEAGTNTSSASFCFDMRLFVGKMLTPFNNLITNGQLKDIEYGPDDPYLMTKLHYDKAVLCRWNHRPELKCFYNTQGVVLVYNHQPKQCLSGVPRCRIDVNTGVAYVHHHKDVATTCHQFRTVVQDPFRYDPSILRFKDRVMKSRDKVLAEIF